MPRAGTLGPETYVQVTAPINPSAGDIWVQMAAVAGTGNVVRIFTTGSGWVTT